MDKMRSIISQDIGSIRKGLSSDPNIDYYHDVAEFVSPYTMKVGSAIITSKMIFLCTGSKTTIPNVKGLEEAGYLTSDTVLEMTKLPASIAIIGGGYIAAEYGHFFSSMGSKVTIIGRNKQFILKKSLRFQCWQKEICPDSWISSQVMKSKKCK